MGKKIVFTFGRFVPPTEGHARVINGVVALAHSLRADVRVYPSHSFDASKNPLPFDKKIEFLRALFPHANVASDPRAISPFHVCKILSDEGYTDVTMVAGSDRVDSYRSQIAKYIGHHEPAKNFNFNHFEVVSAGERDPDAEGVSGISGTKMRAFVKSDDFTSFARHTPTKNVTLARAIFREIKKHLKEMAMLPTDRETGTESLVSTYKKDTPGQENAKLINKARRIILKKRNTNNVGN